MVQGYIADNKEVIKMALKKSLPNINFENNGGGIVTLADVIRQLMPSIKNLDFTEEAVYQFILRHEDMKDFINKVYINTHIIITYIYIYMNI